VVKYYNFKREFSKQGGIKMDSEKREGKPLNDAAIQLLENWLGARSVKTTAFKGIEIDLLIPKLEEIEGFHRTRGSIRMHLVRMLEKSAVESGGGTEIFKAKIEKCLKSVFRCFEGELRNLKGELKKKLFQEKREKETLKKENKIVREQNRELREELRSLKKIQAAAEDYLERKKQ